MIQHRILINLVKKQYPQSIEDGCCAGFSEVANNYWLSGNFSGFILLNQFINYRHEQLPELFRALMKVNLKTLNQSYLQIKALLIPGPSTEEIEVSLFSCDPLLILESKAMLESILLYQSPEKFCEVFDGIFNQKNIAEISIVAEPNKLKKIGGKKLLATCHGIYSVEELLIYLDWLQMLADSTKIVLAISLVGDRHRTSLLYCPVADSWIFLDINTFEPYEKQILYDLKDLSQKIYLAVEIFKTFSPSHEFVAISTTIQCAGDYFDVSKRIMIECLKSEMFLDLHKLDEKKIKRTSATGLTYATFYLKNKNLIPLEKLLQDAKNWDGALSFLINTTDSKGYSSLHYIALHGHTRILEHFIGLTKSGFDVIDYNSKSSNGNTALHYIALCGHARILEHFIDLTKSGFDVIDYNSKSSDGNTALHNIALRGHTRMLEHFIDLTKSGFDVIDYNLENKAGLTAPMMAILGCDTNIVQQFISLLLAGYDVIDYTRRCFDGLTLCHHIMNDIKIFKMYLQIGILENRVEMGQSALHTLILLFSALISAALHKTEEPEFREAFYHFLQEAITDGKHIDYETAAGVALSIDDKETIERLNAYKNCIDETSKEMEQEGKVATDKFSQFTLG